MLYERIKELCKNKGVTISQLERDLGMAKGSMSKIDKHKPSAEKMERIAEYFRITYHELINQTYYDDDGVKEYTLFLKDHPEYRVLFDASRRVKPEDIALVRALIERFNNGAES